MFTGIIEEIGRIRSLKRGSNSAILEIGAVITVESTRAGDSIAVNGVCLTVTSIYPEGYSVDVMPETLNRSNLGDLIPGSEVNLERALRLGDRLGGHLLSGHIDGIGIISQFTEDENAKWVTISIAEAQTRYIVEKGSIAIDGISLTVAETKNNLIKVSLIPLTQKTTILSHKKVRDRVNLETDMIGRYIEKLLINREQNIETSKIDMQFLKENGYV
jgi:riboflavin synthase